MAKYCTNCGKELDENAAICLNCGVLIENTNNNQQKEKKKGLPTWAIILIIVGCFLFLPIVLIIIFFIFAFSTVNKVIENSPNQIWGEESTIIKEGTIGDTLTSENFKIKLTNVEIYSSIGTEENSMDKPQEGKEYLVFFFDVENISTESNYISDFDFVGYLEGEEIYSEYLYNEVNGVSDLNATLKPNEKIKGFVSFEVDTNWKEFELLYNEWFDNSELIFKVVNERTINVTGA